MSGTGSIREKVASNLARVRERIAAAAERAGRTPESVKLVAVTKYAAPNDGFLDALLAAGCSDFGENRPQKLLEKSAVFAARPEIRWHFIGSLQKNKIRKILSLIRLIHSVDSVELAEAIDRIAREESIPAVEILLEANISGEQSKQGFEPDELPDALGKIASLSRLRVRGLMGMGGLDAPPTEVGRQFAALRRLLDECRAAYPELSDLTELSIGMSHDFEIAVREGATLVRIGSILYP